MRRDLQEFLSEQQSHKPLSHCKMKKLFDANTCLQNFRSDCATFPYSIITVLSSIFVFKSEGLSFFCSIELTHPSENKKRIRNVYQTLPFPEDLAALVSFSNDSFD